MVENTITKGTGRASSGIVVTTIQKPVMVKPHVPGEMGRALGERMEEHREKKQAAGKNG
jgi:hypothetical protein